MLSQKQIGTICFAFIFSIFSISAFAANNCTGATYYDADSDTCLNCPTGYDYNTTAGKTDISECQIHCNAGTWNPEYTQLEYIESTGTQYIDTGYIPNQDSAMILRILAPVLTTGAFSFGGAYNGAWTPGFGLYGQNTKYKMDADYGNQDVVITETAYDANVIYNISLNKNVATVINESTTARYSKTLNAETFTAPHTLELFRLNIATPRYGKFRLYSAQIYDNGTVVRNMVPARRNSDNVLGMYDTVTRQFFTNSGTGSFTGGPDTATFIIGNGGICVDVGVGYYAPASTTNYGSAGTRTACPIGTYSSITNAASCTSCSGATYNDETAQAACKSCPAGYDYNTTTGKTSVSQCQKQCAGGTYVEKSVPAEYDRLEYIESTGVRCINTGYVLDENDEVEVDYTWTNLSNANDKIIIDGGNVAINLFGTGNNQRWYAKFGHTKYANTTGTFPESQASGTFTLKKGSFSVNGTKLLSLTFTSMGSATMKIFCRLASGNEIRNSIYAQIGGVRITNNGTMVHNYVPVRRRSDAIVGLYDIVSGVFLTNVNANNFIAGPVRNWEFGSCTDVGTGYWAAASIVNAGSTSTRTACPAGTFTIGYGHGADEANDCGRILHLGDSVIYTRRNKPTTPALNIRMENGDMYYIGLSTTDHTVSRLHFESGGTQWTAFDDSLYYGERDYDTGEKITQ